MDKLFTAVDTIVSKRIENLPYDKTITATITNIDHADEGAYIVDDGTTTFAAYSENTDYQLNQQVYVNVPQGDYQKNRIIIGKYFPNDDNKFKYNYVSPMNTFVNITGDLINTENEYTLTANSEETTVLIWQSNVQLKDYDILGISGKFRSWLNDYNDIISGEYGIRIDIYSDQATSNSQGQKLFYSFYLSSSEMIGDPYNYDTYFLSEKTFDISGIKQINKIVVYFYQNQRFKSQKQGYIQPTDTANLFLKEPILAFGYDLSKITEDKVLLYSFNPDIYYSAATVDIIQNNTDVDFTKLEEERSFLNSYNAKDINLRWIHLLTEEEGSGTYNVSSSGISSTRAITIDEFDDMEQPFNIKWYKYNKVEDTTGIEYDEHAGEYWDELVDKKNNFLINIIPDIDKAGEQYKAIIEYPSKESVEEQIELDLDVNDGLYDQKQAILDSVQMIEDMQMVNNLYYIQSLQDLLTYLEQGYFQRIEEIQNNTALSEEERLAAITEVTKQYNSQHASYTSELNSAIAYNPGSRYAYFAELLDDANGQKFINDINIQVDQYKSTGYYPDPESLNKMIQDYLDKHPTKTKIKILKSSIPTYFSQTYITTFLDNLSYSNYQTIITNFFNQFQEDFQNNILEIIKDYEENEKNLLTKYYNTYNQIQEINAEIELYRNLELSKIQYYVSEPIIFNNSNPNIEIEKKINESIKSLEIIATDELQGVYNIYENEGQIKNLNDAHILRTLEARYKKYDEDSLPIENGETIIWRIPLLNTMIERPEEGVEYSQYSEAPKGEVTGENYKEGCYYLYNTENQQYVQILPISEDINYSAETTYYKRNDVSVQEENGFMIITKTANATQDFRIKSFCQSSLTNNEIFCTVKKGDTEFNASINLSFSSVGNNGTDYTFYLEFFNNENNFALPIQGFTEEEKNEGKDKLNIRAKLFNDLHTDITSTAGVDFNWKVLNNTNVKYYPENTKASECYIKIKEDYNEMAWKPEDFNHVIVKCQCTLPITLANENNSFYEIGADGKSILKSPDARDITLTAFLPIPVIKNRDLIAGYNGNSLISYDNSGTSPICYEGKFRIYDKNGSSIGEEENSQNTIKWEIYGITMPSEPEPGEEQTIQDPRPFYPQISEDGYLQVPTIYLMGDNTPISIQCKVNDIVEFILPLRITKRIYNSKVINSWDGSLTFNKNDGIILSTMMGAGYKDDENRFNGVMLGEMAAINKEASDSIYYTGTGLYGFNAGEKSFGFNINGVGFIGKLSGAQILFSGQEGSITSASYEASIGDENGIVETIPSLIQQEAEPKGGLHLDLDDGRIDFLSRKFYYSITDENDTITNYYGRINITIDANPLESEPYFRITNYKNKSLIYIGGDNSNFYLQSENYDASKDTGTFINLNDGNFHSTTGGKIGCWKFDKSRMYDNSNSTGYTGVNRYGSGMAFWAGGTDLTGNNAPFNVSHAGKLSASNVDITGGNIGIGGINFTCKISDGMISFVPKKNVSWGIGGMAGMRIGSYGYYFEQRFWDSGVPYYDLYLVGNVAYVNAKRLELSRDNSDGAATIACYGTGEDTWAYTNLTISTKNWAGLYSDSIGENNVWLSYFDSNGKRHHPSDSDIRFKENIEKISDYEVNSVLSNVNIVNFNYTYDTNKAVYNGVIAQELRDVLIKYNIGYRSYLLINNQENSDFPSLIYSLDHDEEKVRYEVEYDKFTPLLWRGWQIHNDKIEHLQKEIQNLKEKIYENK